MLGGHVAKILGDFATCIPSRDHASLAMPSFRKIFKRYVRTRSVPGNMHVKFEVHIFNCIGTISI